MHSLLYIVISLGTHTCVPNVITVTTFWSKMNDQWTLDLADLVSDVKSFLNKLFFAYMKLYFPFFLHINYVFFLCSYFKFPQQLSKEKAELQSSLAASEREKRDLLRGKDILQAKVSQLLVLVCNKGVWLDLFYDQ